MTINLLINELESVKNYKIYSKKNNEYEKIFGTFTLKSLIKTLKNPIKIKKPTFLEEMSEKYPNEEDQISQESYSTNKKKEKIKELCNQKNTYSLLTTNSREKIKVNFGNSKHGKPIDIDITPTPWTYNPKYDLIFKRVPVTTIFNSPKKTENNRINFSSNNSFILKNFIEKKNNIMCNTKKKKKKLRLKSLKIYNKEINLNNRNIKNNNIIRKQFLDKSNYYKNKIHRNDINNNLLNINKRNKTIYKIKNNLPSFSRDKYFSNSQKTNFDNQKRNKNFLFKTNIKINSSNEKYNNVTKRIFDFSKMSKRNFEIILNNSTLKYPSFYHYDPKFDYITQSNKVILNFGINHHKNIYEKKKFLLKKMWCSYADLSKDYYLINNSKLNENKELN